MKMLNARKELCTQVLQEQAPDPPAPDPPAPDPPAPDPPAPDPQEQETHPPPQVPVPDCPPQGPTPHAPLQPNVPHGPVHNTATCPEEQQHEAVAARGKSTKKRVVVSCGKNKRKKQTIDCEKVFADVQQEFLQDSISTLPILHTPHSMFSMLCDTFEQEFPNRLPRAIVDQVLLILQEEP